MVSIRFATQPKCGTGGDHTPIPALLAFHPGFGDRGGFVDPGHFMQQCAVVFYSDGVIEHSRPWDAGETEDRGIVESAEGAEGAE